MTVSRLPFALEDLEREICSVCNSKPTIALILDPVSFDQVTKALRSHYGSQAEIGGIGGVAIVNAAEHERKIEELEESKDHYMREAGQ